MEGTVRRRTGTNVGGLKIYEVEMGPFTWQRDSESQDAGVIITDATDEDIDAIFDTSELPESDEYDSMDATDQDIIDLFGE